MEKTTLPLTLSLRSSENTDGPAHIQGLAVPYDVPIRVGAYSETIARGAIDAASVVGLPLLWQHDRGAIAGRITDAKDSDAGLEIGADIIPTAVGRDAEIALRAQAISGLSIGFESLSESWDGLNVTREAIGIREISLATLPAFDDARVLSVREAPRKETNVPETVTPDYATRDDLVALESRMSASAVTPPERLGVVDTFVRQLADGAATRHLRALADVVGGPGTGATNAGILPPSWSTEVRNYVDAQRYMFGLTGSIGWPQSGMTLTLPKVLTHTLVGPRGQQKSEIPSRALDTGTDTYTAKWFAGGVDVALELIWQSEPSVWNIVVQDILSQYAIVTDESLTDDVEAAATAGSGALDFTDWGTVAASIIEGAEAVRAVTGQPGDRLSLTTASWASLIGLTDADGRRIFATGGATNSDGAAGILARSVNIGGVTAAHNPRASKDVLFNEKSVRVAERPPSTLVADTVSLMGRDLGVLGGYLLVPWSAGIIAFAD